MIPFHIVALVYIMIAGKPLIDEPMRIPHKILFTSEQACNDYLKSDAFGHDRTDLAKIVSSEVSRKLELSDAAPEHEDDTPSATPGIAITASCEADNSL